MAAHKLIDVLDKLDRLHVLLLELAVKKTDVIKKNDMDGLDQLLKDEQKFVAAIHTMEQERQRAAAVLTGNNESTMTECIAKLEANEKNALLSLQSTLHETIKRLKEQNELNQQLIYQSLQFVNLNLSMINPQPEQPTYTHPARSGAQHKKQSMFDSQA
ncbi:flagellar protein FlgN [Pseudobacillus sp. FSL P4-0506]|uniref:flagellar protein FlgN n=1 Tax=Pseudobacillus sp. FSL P4-0506 TaxID=2921576 RepID=UPI0030F78956